MTRNRPTVSRLALEGGTIIVSILIAFVVDASWDGRAERQRVSEHFDQLELQLAANDGVLERARVGAVRAQEAAARIVEAVGPGGGAATPDSMALVIDRVFRLNPGTVELSAVEAVLSEGTLGSSSSAEFQRSLIEYRNLAEAFEYEVRQYHTTRSNLLDYLVAQQAPIAVIIDGASGTASDFPLPVDALMGDVGFESRVFLSGLTAGRVLSAIGQLEGSAGSLVALLASGAI